MGRLIDADKLKADLEKAISKNEDMDCLDFLRVASVIDAQPTAYDPDKVVKQLKAEFKKYYGENWNKAPYLVKAIEIVKADVDTENNHNKEVYFTALEDYHRLISEECKFMLIKCNPYALHLKEYNDKVLEQLKAGGNS